MSQINSDGDQELLRQYRGETAGGTKKLVKAVKNIKGWEQHFYMEVDASGCAVAKRLME